LTKLLPKIALSVGAIATVLALSGCIKGLTPLPDAERYQYVNQVKEDLDYKAAGEVIKENYDNSDGVFGVSYFEATVKGPEAFDTLRAKLQLLATKPCNPILETSIGCYVGQVDVALFGNREQANFRITDANNGRNPN
jgi:hypothetical protein